MTVSSVPLIMSRIKSASPRSKIAVFKTRAPETNEPALDAVFANTVMTEARIQSHDRNLVGVYWRDSNQRDTREKLYRALEQQ